MGDAPYQSLGLGIVKLIVEGKQKAKESVKQLVNQAREEVKDTAIQRKVLELIEAILVNKFPNLSREEIKAMLSLELIRGTRVYEELKEEVQIEIIAKLLQRGMSVQEVAEILELDVEVIRNVAGEQS
jgi:predicted transposase YdaD